MRRVSFLFLFLVLSSLLAVVTAPVRAETAQYYALSFDGADDYISLQGENLENLEAVTVVVLAEVRGWGTLFSWGGYVHTKLRVSDGRIAFSVSNGSMYSVSTVWTHKKVVSLGRRYLIVATADTATNSVKVLVNNETVLSDTLGVDVIESSKYHATKYIASVDGSSDFFAGKIYLVLIYNRALSDNEIAQIYENPLNPPKDGLVLWLAPGSVDTTNGVWQDKSGNRNDGTIYGATYVPLRPVSESTPSPYGLYFDGVDDYVDVNAIDIGKTFSVVALLRPLPSTQKFGYLIGADNFIFRVRSDYMDAFKVYVYDGSSWEPRVVGEYQVNNEYFVATTYDGSYLKLYLNGQLKDSKSRTLAGNVVIHRIGSTMWGSYTLHAVLYSLIIYHRALSDDEIRQIYENPLNPPRDGLVLFYSPYSYDLETGRWLNIAPIFPTIPLAEELDGVNYGAEPVRVSIPRVQAYDATNNSEISVYNLTVKTTNGETFIPWFMPLPYNQTLTLNVSAVGYKSSIVSVQAPIDNLVFYLYPSQVITSWERPELNVNLDNITADEYLPDASKDIDKFSSLFTRWLGGEYFKWLLSLDLEGMLKDFFNNPPIPGLGILLALMIWAGAVLMTWLYFEEPEPVFVEGNIVYFGLMQFIDVSPGILAVPLGVFILFLGYKQLYKALKVWAKR